MTSISHDQKRQQPSRLNRKNLFSIILVFLGLFLPFLNKAFHIDDAAFLSLGQGIDWNPLIAIPPDNYGTYESSHPFLLPYLLKASTAIVGYHELFLHALFLVFPALALFFLNRISRSIFETGNKQRTLLLVLFCAAPPFLVNAQNLMADIPALALLLGALSLQLSGVNNNQRRDIFIAGGLLTLGVFISYQTLAFAPLFLLYALCKSKQRITTLISLSIPLLSLSLWMLLIYQRYEVFPLLPNKIDSGIAREVKSGFSFAAFYGKTIFLLATTGIFSLFPLILHYLSKQKFQKALRQLLLLSVPCLFAVANLPEYNFATKSALALCMAIGLLTLQLFIVCCFRDYRHPRTRARGALLFCWVAITIGYNIAIMPFGAARYLLPLFPPLFLVLTQMTEGHRFNCSRRVLAATVTLALILGLACAFSDYRFAGSYRNLAQEVNNLHKDLSKGNKIWYIGGWGMDYYFTEAGAEKLSANSTAPKVGDLIIMPEMPRFWVPAPQVQVRTAIYGTTEISSPVPLRLFNRRSNAGFYCHLWGYLPLAFSNEPDEVFTLIRVIR